MTTITLPRAVVQQALDALTGKTDHRYFGRCPSAGAHDERDPRCPACKTATELRAALEQPCAYPACPYPCMRLPDCREAEQPQAEPWRPIESVPKNKTVWVFYKNALGNGRTMRATYYPPETLESDTEESGWADEGWYEESEAYEYLMPLEGEPTHWMPLPPAPGAADPAPNHAELLACMVAGAAATAARTNELEALLAGARHALAWALDRINKRAPHQAVEGDAELYRFAAALGAFTRIDAALGEKK